MGYICSKTRQKFKNAQTRSKTGGIARKWTKAGGFFDENACSSSQRGWGSRGSLSMSAVC